MLVLSREVGGEIMISDNIRITVVAIRGDKVRIGIDAPKDTPVHRREVYDAIKRTEAEQQLKEPQKTLEGRGDVNSLGFSDPLDGTY